MTFSEFLKRIRNTAGYTQKNIADLLGVDRSTYSYYETGKTEPNIRQLKKIAALYNLRLDDLINCRFAPIDNVQMQTNEPQEQALVNANRFRLLSTEEQCVLMMYRAAADKKDFMEYMRAYCPFDMKDDIE